MFIRTLFAIAILIPASSCKISAIQSGDEGSGGKKGKSSDSSKPTTNIPPESKSNATTIEPTTDGETNVTCPKYPLVFLHGFMGGKKIGGFVGVKKHFESKGCKVGITEVTAVNGMEVRSKQVAEQVQTFLTDFGAEKVHIIAHSQGGLDARYAISKLDLAKSVASLSTLSTPHYGTFVADIALAGTSDPSMKGMTDIVIKMLSNFVSTQGGKDNSTDAALRSLSTAYMKNEFNPQISDVSGVLYQSWGARTGAGTPDQTKMILALSQGLLKMKTGENDGVVPVSSTKWGDFKGVLDADHLDLVGLKLEDKKGTFDHLKFLNGLVNELATKGM